MEIDDLRRRIDELDRALVAVISERAKCARRIGQIKRASAMPVYEPNRERTIYDNVRALNKGPLPDLEMTHIYERIIDVMRSLQQKDIATAETTVAPEGSKAPAQAAAETAKEPHQTGKQTGKEP